MEKIIERQYAVIEQLQRLLTKAESARTRGEIAKAKEVYSQITPLWNEINQNQLKLEKMPLYESGAEDYKKNAVIDKAAEIMGDVFIIIQEKFTDIKLNEQEKMLVETRKEQNAEQAENAKAAAEAQKQMTTPVLNFFGQAAGSINPQLNPVPKPGTSNATKAQKIPDMNKTTTSHEFNISSEEESDNDDEKKNDELLENVRKAEEEARDLELALQQVNQRKTLAQQQLQQAKQEEAQNQEQDKRNRKTQKRLTEENGKQASLKEVLLMLAETQKLLIKQNQNENNDNGQRNMMRTKPLEFPTFDGEILKYATFKSNFNRLAEECDLGTAQRYITLRTVLAENVLNTIAAIEDVPENYEAVWKRLDERYYNRRAIFTNVIANLLDAPSTIYGNRESYIELSDKISAFKVNMEHLGFEINDCADAIAAQILLEKLSDECQFDLADSIKDKKAILKLDQIQKFLEDHAMIFAGRNFDENYDRE